MRAYYNRIAGQNLERLAALSDGIFAVAMTLLVLDLRVPASETIRSGGEGALWIALEGLGPHLLPYIMSFLTLGIFWVGQQTQLNYFARSDRDLTWIHLAFLLAVTLIPFSTGLLAEFITFRIAIVVYWLNLLLLGAMLFASVQYAQHAGLVKEEMTAEVRSAHVRRILIFLVLYTFATLLCVINTYVSIVLLILTQFISILAPRIRPLDRI